MWEAQELVEMAWPVPRINREMLLWGEGFAKLCPGSSSCLWWQQDGPFTHTFPILPSMFLVFPHLGPLHLSLVPPVSAASARVWAGLWAGMGVQAGDRAALQNVGCDYEIDSNAVEDRCGVCHGDGSTCHTVKKTFEDSEGLGKGTRLCPQNTTWLFPAAPGSLCGFSSQLINFGGIRPKRQHGETWCCHSTSCSSEEKYSLMLFVSKGLKTILCVLEWFGEV